MFAAGRMVLRVFLGSHGTLVAVSAPFMMPLRDSDIPMNVPFTFSNKQPLHLKLLDALLRLAARGNLAVDQNLLVQNREQFVSNFTHHVLKAA
jgi:hypothetical protein